MKCRLLCSQQGKRECPARRKKSCGAFSFLSGCKPVYNDKAKKAAINAKGVYMINKAWPTYQSLSDATRFVRALKITGRKQATNGLVTLSFNDGYPDIQIDPMFNNVWNPAVGGWLVQASDGSQSYLSDASFTAQFKQSSGSQIQPGDINGAGATGIDVLKSATPAAARTAIGVPQDTGAYVIGNRNGGDPTTITLATTTAGNTVAQRDASGAIATATPVSNAHAATKAYVDTLKPATASSADKLATARTVALSGAVTGSQSFDGSGNITIASTLASGGVSDTNVAANAAIKGTKLATASAITSAGGSLQIPAGSTMDAALKIIADKVNPA